MINTDILNEVIDQSGLKRTAIARKMGLSDKGLKLKIDGVNEFKGSEIQKLRMILNLTDQERERIFFSGKMNLNHL